MISTSAIREPEKGMLGTMPTMPCHHPKSSEFHRVFALEGEKHGGQSSPGTSLGHHLGMAYGAIEKSDDWSR